MRYQIPGQAVVLGGSMAGMLAARVLSDHFERVVIIERDEYPESPTPRAGVPQGRHLHALLTRGHRMIEEFFPGIARDLQSAGAEVLDMGRDFAWRTPAGWGVRFESGLESFAASRPLMDHVVRERLGQLTNVVMATGAVGLSLLASPDKRRVTGVRVRRSNGVAESVTAALVVDASGRMSNAPAWLRQLGYDAPEESVVDARLGYASRLYRRRPGHERDFRAVFIQAAPPDQPRAGVAFPIEGDRWLVTQCGGGGDFAPTEEAAFVQFARSLPSAEIYNLIRDAEPLGPITGYRRTENRWRHYERLKRRPEGFTVLGDAACAFNPVYGQGITTAALQAKALGAWVQKGAARTGVFQKAVAAIIAAPWALATGEDMRYHGSSLRPKLHERLLQAYVHAVMGASSYDVETRRALLNVFTMIEAPGHLLRPSVFARVAWGAVRNRLGAQADRRALVHDAA